MENVDRDYEILEKGIKQLLGKEEYPAAEKASEPCMHTSDGFVYEETPLTLLFQCSKCSIQYDVWKANGQPV